MTEPLEPGLTREDKRLESTLTRWRHRETGERLVAIAVKRDEVSMVLPVHALEIPSPLGWMPEASFLREYEVCP